MAIGLLVVFTVAIAVNIARGRRPDCRCFGKMHRATTGERALLRNAILIAVAGIVVADAWSQPAESAWNVLFDRAVGWVLVAVVAAAFLAVLIVRSDLVASRLRAIGWVRRLYKVTIVPVRARILAAIARRRVAHGKARQGPAIGSVAKYFMLPVVGGEVDRDSLLEPNRPVLLVFVDPASGNWDELLSDVADWRARHSARLNVAVVSRGTAKENAQRINGHGPVLLQNHREMLEAYKVDAFPTAVLIGPDARVAAVAVGERDRIRELVAQTVSEPQT
jgi:hypothetical protein